MNVGAPLPDGADAVVQIENTEKLPVGPGGQQRVRIIKVIPYSHSRVQTWAPLASQLFVQPAVVACQVKYHQSQPPCRPHEWQLFLHESGRAPTVTASCMSTPAFAMVDVFINMKTTTTPLSIYISATTESCTLKDWHVQPAKGPGDDVRALGSDIAAGEVVLAAGSLIGAAEIGLLATVGCATVKVHFLFPL